MRDLVRGMAVAVMVAATSSCGGAGAPASQTPVREPSTIEPATDSPSPPADPGRTRATDAVFAEFDGATPGCAVAVHLNGNTAMTGAYGSADLGAGTPLTPDTVFDIASVSKQITAGMAMGLVLEGRLSLEDDVTAWLPDLDVTPGSVSVADLVHHTSGLPDYVDLLDVDVETVTTNADTMAALAGIDAHRPGTRFHYSNTNYFLLGQIIEAVTGQGLPDYAEDVVFAPLDMDDTRIRDDQGTFTPDQAVGWYDEGAGTYSIARSAWRQTGDGAVHTNVGDLLRWARLFTDDPRPSGIGSQAWLDLMLDPGSLPDAGYAGGINLYEDDEGHQALYHLGAWVGVSADLEVLPADELAVAVTCNIDDYDAEALADEVVAIWTEP